MSRWGGGGEGRQTHEESKCCKTPRYLTATHTPTHTLIPQACHRWWKVLLTSVRATDLEAAEVAHDTSLRACFARLPLSDDLLLPQLAVYLIAG